MAGLSGRIVDPKTPDPRKTASTIHVPSPFSPLSALGASWGPHRDDGATRRGVRSEDAREALERVA